MLFIGTLLYTDHPFRTFLCVQLEVELDGIDLPLKHKPEQRNYNFHFKNKKVDIR